MYSLDRLKIWIERQISRAEQACVIATFSRMQEHQADLFGLESTRDPAAAASAFLKFGRLDLDEYHVHPWIEALLYSHPSLENRVRCAQEYAREHGITDD